MIRDTPVSGEVVNTQAQSEEKATRRTRRIGMLGPAFVAAIAYVDPGNVAANLQAGAKYGYLLVWVLVIAVAAAGLCNSFQRNWAWPPEDRCRSWWDNGWAGRPGSGIGCRPRQ